MALKDNLVSYWKLQESSGTRVDAHGSNDLTDNNTVGVATGVSGNGADFESTNTEYLSINNASQSGLNITGDITIGLWYKFETVQNCGFAGRYDTSTNSREYFFAYDGNLAFYMSQTGSSPVNKNVSWTPSAGTWYHLAMVYDASAGSVTFYVNGSQLGSTQTGLYTSIYDGSSDFLLAGFLSGPNWTPDGVMDEVFVATRTWSATEVAEIYNSGSGKFYDDWDAGGAVITPRSTLSLMGVG